MAMSEDACRARRENAAEVLAGFRHVAINLLNGVNNFDGGLKRKQKKASRNTKFLAEVLAGQGAS